MMGISTSKTSNTTMVDRLAYSINNIEVEAAMRAVDRGMYYEIEEGDVVDPYDDDPWRRGNLHLSAPCIYARALDALDLKPGLSFLNLGSGTGYLNTIVGLLIGPNGSNYGIEFHGDVLDFARHKLQSFVENSHALDKFDFIEPIFVQGNCLNLDNNSTYDRVYLGAACAPAVEQFMKRLLNINGILIMPFGNHLRRYTRVSVSEWHHETMMDVNFTQMILQGPDETIIRMPKSSPKSLKTLCRSQIRQHLRHSLDSRFPEIKNKDCYKNRKREIQAGPECYYHSGNPYFNPDNHTPDGLKPSVRPTPRKSYKTADPSLGPLRTSARARELAAALSLARCPKLRNRMRQMFDATGQVDDEPEENLADNNQASIINYVTRQHEARQASGKRSTESKLLASTSSGASSTKDLCGLQPSGSVAGTSSSGDNEENPRSDRRKASKNSNSHNRKDENDGINSGAHNAGDDNDDDDQDHHNESGNSSSAIASSNENNHQQQQQDRLEASQNDDRNNLLRAMRDIEARIVEAVRDVRRYPEDAYRESTVMQRHSSDADSLDGEEPCPPQYRDFCKSLCERHFRGRYLPRLQMHRRLRDADVNFHNVERARQPEASTDHQSQLSELSEQQQNQQVGVNRLKRKRRNRSPLESSCSEMEDVVDSADQDQEGQDVNMSDTNTSTVNSNHKLAIQKHLAKTLGASAPKTSQQSDNHHHNQKRLPQVAITNLLQDSKPKSSSSYKQQLPSSSSSSSSSEGARLLDPGCSISTKVDPKFTQTSDRIRENKHERLAPYLLNCGLINQEKREQMLADSNQELQSGLLATSDNDNNSESQASANLNSIVDQDESNSIIAQLEAHIEMDTDENEDVDEDYQLDDHSTPSETSSISNLSDLWSADEDNDDDLDDMFSPPGSPLHRRLHLNQPRLFAYSALGFYQGHMRSRFDRRPPMSLVEREQEMRIKYPLSPKYGWRHSYLNRPECELYRQHMEKLIKTLPLPETVKLFLNLDRDFESPS